MKKILVCLMLLIVCAFIGCGYEPKYSDEFYIDYIKNYNEGAELYDLEKKDSNLTIEDKKEIDESIYNTLTN